MGIVLLIVVGIAAGFLATRFMGLDTDVPTTIAIGVSWIERTISMDAIAFSPGWWVSAVELPLLGAMALIWLWKTYGR